MATTTTFLLVEDDPNDVFVVEREFKRVPHLRLYHVGDLNENDLIKVTLTCPLKSALQGLYEGCRFPASSTRRVVGVATGSRRGFQSRLVQGAILRPECFGRLAHPEPVTRQGLADLDQIVKIHRLDQKRIGPQLIGQVYIM
jgi:hypothetical protein